MEIDREQILQAFVEESREQLEMMEESLVELERNPGDIETVRTAFRVVHTMKGSASSLGFPELAEYAHEVEEILDGLREGAYPVNAEFIGLLLKVVDVLRKLVPTAVAGKPLRLRRARDLLRQLGRLEQAVTDRLRPDPPAGGEPEEPPRRLEDRQRTLRVDVEKLDHLLNLTGEIAVLRGRSRRLLAEAGRLPAEFHENEHELDSLLLSLQEEILRARMVGVHWIFRPHIRTVRDAAQACGKLARLRFEGEEAEVDTSVIEHLRDPITHMVRNAVDHGIEIPAERNQAGKDPCGTVTLRAIHERGSIVIEVEDDGKGLDREGIARRARERSLHPDPESLSDGDLLQLICSSGFSTSAEVSNLSGRGVGMDVVRRNVETLRGSLSLRSRPGRGTVISIRLPLTLATIPGFGVGVEDETYVIPLDVVAQCIDFPRDTGGGEPAGVIAMDDAPLPFLRLRDHFQVGSRRTPAREKVVVVEHDGRRVGLVIDELLGETQTVVKPLGRLFQGLPGFSGSAVLGDGRVALILDVPGLVESAAQNGGIGA